MFFFVRIFFTFTNSVEHGEMQHSAASHLRINFCISTGLGDPRMNRVNMTSGDKKKYFALQETYKSYRGEQRVSPSKGRNSSPAPDLPFCLSFSLKSVYRLFVSVCQSICFHPSVCPSILHTVLTIQANNNKQKLNETRGLLTLYAPRKNASKNVVC